MAESQRKNNVVFGRFNNQQSIATTAETVESTTADPINAWFDQLIEAIRTNSGLLQNNTSEAAKPLQDEIRSLQVEANGLTEKLNNTTDPKLLLDEISAFAKKVHAWSTAIAALEPEPSQSLALAAAPKEQQQPKASNVPLYVGLGVGAAAIIGAFLLLSKKQEAPALAGFTKTKPKKIKLKRVGAIKAR